MTAEEARKMTQKASPELDKRALSDIILAIAQIAAQAGNLGYFSVPARSRHFVLRGLIELGYEVERGFHENELQVSW